MSRFVFITAFFAVGCTKIISTFYGKFRTRLANARAVWLPHFDGAYIYRRISIHNNAFSLRAYISARGLIMKKRIFSAAQPTGRLHIGNYLGALKNWVALQEEYESLYCIVNLHALTLPQDPTELRQKTLDLARIYLAAGVDPEISTIFIQSDVAEHAELTWVLSCIARMGELERMTQFKEKSKGAGERAWAGIFNYPLLRRRYPAVSHGPGAGRTRSEAAPGAYS